MSHHSVNCLYKLCHFVAIIVTMSNAVFCDVFANRQWIHIVNIALMMSALFAGNFCSSLRLLPTNKAEKNIDVFRDIGKNYRVDRSFFLVILPTGILLLKTTYVCLFPVLTITFQNLEHKILGQVQVSSYGSRSRQQIKVLHVGGLPLVGKVTLMMSKNRI